MAATLLPHSLSADLEVALRWEGRWKKIASHRQAAGGSRATSPIHHPVSVLARRRRRRRRRSPSCEVAPASAASSLTVEHPNPYHPPSSPAASADPHPSHHHHARHAIRLHPSPPPCTTAVIRLFLFFLLHKKEVETGVGERRRVDKALLPFGSITEMMAVTNGVIHASSREPLFSFGVIADVQYADIPDGRSFLGVPRYYRHSISVLQRAVSTWNKQHNIKFSINFGDIIDGYCPKDKSLWAVQKVLDEFEKFDGPTYHMFGNHCLYNLPRGKLVSLLKMPTDSDRAYYDFSPCPEYRFVVLDAYDFSALGWPRDHPVTAEAMKFLEEKNPNSDKNSPDGLVGVDRRFVMFNGGVGKEQLSWLNDVLQDASARRQNVILCSHLPMDPGSASFAALMWNYDEVMAIVRQYKCVKACFAGHDHKGGHSVDSHGVHHRTLEAALECPPGTSAFGHIEVYPDKLLLVGSDKMADTEMCFEP
uniref:Manganese-dependent ADP-ribose/CDP-alcohol diphosphatase n=1 Tax=Oryza glumipatula TaxID=40148 RepID=A0A0E0API1_9ORYZ